MTRNDWALSRQEKVFQHLKKQLSLGLADTACHIKRLNITHPWVQNSQRDPYLISSLSIPRKWPQSHSGAYEVPNIRMVPGADTKTQPWGWLLVTSAYAALETWGRGKDSAGWRARLFSKNNHFLKFRRCCWVTSCRVDESFSGWCCISSVIWWWGGMQLWSG